MEHDNMLTNALAYRAGIDANDNLGLYSSEYSLMPLGSKGLGGLFLFDGRLEEDAGNIHFPMDVHLTGCAGRGTGSPASNLQGTIDSTASGFINGKFVSVWNFLPNQGNGVIASLALTHTRAGETPFHMYRANAWNRISTAYRHFVAMDPDTDTAYFSYNYQAASTISFYRQKKPERRRLSGFRSPPRPMKRRKSGVSALWGAFRFQLRARMIPVATPPAMARKLQNLTQKAMDFTFFAICSSVPGLISPGAGAGAAGAGAWGGSSAVTGFGSSTTPVTRL